MPYENMSLIVAFLGGMITLLPACGPALLPAFFAYTFKRKQDLVKAAIYFGIGFALLFIPFSLGLNLLVNLLVDSRTLLFSIVGWILIFFGLLSFVGFKLPIYSLWVPKVTRPWDALLLGLVFGLTSSTCIAPIYGAILSLNVLNDGFEQFMLLIFFVLGMIVPLVVMGYVFERFGFSRFLKRFAYRFNLVAAASFIVLGIFFIVSKGTPFTNFSQSTGIMTLFEEANQLFLTINPHFDLIILLGLLAAAIWVGFKGKFASTK